MMTASALSSSSTSAAASRLPGGLVYVDRSQPGITRVREGDAFRYRLPAGEWLQDEEHLAHIRRLAIPPAYQDVWICPLPHGHLQATGRDARGRLQYRYHPDWRRVRDASKFERMRAFGQALPRIRARVLRDLGAPGRLLVRERVLAAIVRLLDTTYLRVGNEEYAVANGSYGLTTLRARHARVQGDSIRLRFRGKSGVEHEAQLDDPRVARVVRRCQQLPGQELFRWRGDDGEVHCICSGDVNAYLAEVAGDAGHFTAKDFRTWHGTAHALELTRAACAQSSEEACSQTAARSRARQMVVEVARQLGNTPAVCRKSYIHPAVLALAEDVAPGARAQQRLWQRLQRVGASPRALSAAERRLLAFLRRPLRLAAEAPAAQPSKASKKHAAVAPVRLVHSASPRSVKAQRRATTGRRRAAPAVAVAQRAAAG
ncbi:DNA topoisomerase IB [Melaminivora suipulveris]